MKGAIVKTRGSSSLGGFRLGVLAGSFDEFAVDEGRSGADQGDEVGALTARQRSCADSMSLNAMASPAAREPGPLSPGGWKPFLHHISKSQPAARRTIALKTSRNLPRVLSAGEVQAILDACGRLRDRLLFAVLYDTGMFSVDANRTTGVCSRFSQVSGSAGWSWMPAGVV